MSEKDEGALLDEELCGEAADSIFNHVDNESWEFGSQEMLSATGDDDYDGFGASFLIHVEGGRKLRVTVEMA